MKSFYIGVKGIVIHEEQAMLMKGIKDGTFFTEPPEGQIDSHESFDESLKRELLEELGQVENVRLGDLLTVYRLSYDSESGHGLLLMFFKVFAEMNDIKISEEKEDFLWIAKRDLDDFLDEEKEHVNDGTKAAVKKAFVVKN